MEEKREGERLNKAIREFEARLKEQYAGVTASVMIDSGVTDEASDGPVPHDSLTPWELHLEFSRGQAGWGLHLSAGEPDDLRASDLQAASRKTRLNAMQNFERLLKALDTARHARAAETDEAIRQVELLTRTLAVPAGSSN